MLVSIIIPYYKDEENVYKSVYSALNQTYKSFEIIIVDNENSISSKKILDNFKKKSKKIKIIKNENNKNYAGIGRNLGIKYAKGKLIAFLDSDDFWKKKKLELQVSKMIKTNADILFTNFIAVDNKNKKLYEVITPKILTFNIFLKSCPVCCSSVIIKKKCFSKAIFKDYKTKEDYDLWLRLSKSNFRIESLNLNLTMYRVRSKSLSSLHLNKIINAFRIYYFSLKFSFLYSIFCVIRLYLNAFKKKYL